MTISYAFAWIKRIQISLKLQWILLTSVNLTMGVQVMTSIRQQAITWTKKTPVHLYYFHDEVIEWKHFPRYWPFVRGIHRSPVNSPHKASDAELWWGWWFETPSRSLWRHRNVPAADSDPSPKQNGNPGWLQPSPWAWLRCWWQFWSSFLWAEVRSLLSSCAKITRNVSLVKSNHWGRVTYICVSKLTLVGSDNGLSPCRRQAIIWANAGIWLIRT